MSLFADFAASWAITHAESRRSGASGTASGSAGASGAFAGHDPIGVVYAGANAVHLYIRARCHRAKSQQLSALLLGHESLVAISVVSELVGEVEEENPVGDVVHAVVVELAGR